MCRNFSKIKIQTYFLLRRLDTLFIGREQHQLPSVNSTNEHALSLLSKSKPPEGTVVSTPNQVAGRGQIGSNWESEAGKNICMSVILYPKFLNAGRQFLLSQAVSLAVFDLLEKYFPGQTKIKWPNDIYINGKKAVGILIQNSVSGAQLRSSVIGIGINVNQEIFRSGAPNPTSFKLESGNEFNTGQLINELCHFLENRYLKLKSGNIVPLQAAYLKHLYRFQIPSFFENGNGAVFKGTITGISEKGQLKIYISGKEKLFGLKEIKFL